MNLLLQAMRFFLEPDADTSLAELSFDPAMRAAIRRNRLAPVLAHVAEKWPIESESDAWLKTACHAAMAETVARCAALEAVRNTLCDIPWLLLRGPVLGAALYGDVFLRPFGDLDVLVAEEHVVDVLRRLDEAGATPPAGALADAYYRRYHLHVQRYLPGPARPVLAEVHWRIDHPYTLFTPDLSGVLARARPVPIMGIETSMPGPEDLLLLSALHLLKHAVWLPVWVEQGRVDRLLDAGALIGLLDIALLCRSGMDVEIERAKERAVAWGAAGAVRTCLDAAEAVWPGVVPEATRASFAATPPGRIRRLCERWGGRRPEPDSALSRLQRWRRGGVFRLVRLLDLVEYFCPPPDFLRRRYGRCGMRDRVVHLNGAVRALVGNGLALRRAQRDAREMKT